MKKKIIIGLSVFTLIFFLVTVYIIANIEETTSRLNNLVRLHQIEILREHLLIYVSRIQSELKAGDRNDTTIANNIKNMVMVSDACFNCHHKDDVKKELIVLSSHIKIYGQSVGDAVLSADNSDMANFKLEKAFNVGEKLIIDLNGILTITNKRLEEKTRLAMDTIIATKTTLYIILALGPVFAVILSVIFIKAITSPLNKILYATRKLKTGNLDYKVEPLKDEFGEVAASINEMASSLKQQMRNMQRTEQLRMCGEIATGLAHEIKNPLAGIKISMEFLSDDSCLSTENRDVLSKVIDEVRRIEVLLRGLLNFARPPVPHFAPVKINNIIDICIMFSIKTQALSSADKSKEIMVSKNFDDDIPLVMADHLQLQQVFLNLLLNAIDAMPGGGTLDIQTSCSPDSQLIRIEIADTGAGINKKEMDKIFQPFFTTKSKGTGMGLAITRRIIEEHGGTISVRSEHGRGTTFTIVLPVEQTI